MKFLIFGIAFLAYIGLSSAAGCTDHKTKHEWAVGTDYNPIGECISYTCTGDDAFNAKTCAESAAPDTCKRIPEDLTKAYPECCPKWDCP